MITRLLVAAATATPSPSKTPSGEGAKAGPIGLAVILLLCIACYFLFKSMSKHLRRVREDFPGQHVDPPAAAPVTSPPSPSAAEAPSAPPSTAHPPPGEA